MFCYLFIYTKSLLLNEYQLATVYTERERNVRGLG